MARRNLLIGIALLLAGGIAAYGGLFFMQSKRPEYEKIIEAVENHIVLPSDERPALVTVTDKEKLSTGFLRSAENGDKVLIYQNNRKAIIYRPSLDKLIDIGPVNIDSPPSATGSE